MTDTTRLAGGRITQSPGIVTADQDTILGDGTPQNPLRIASPGAAGEFDADFVSELPFTPILGTPVVVNSDEAVAPANANEDTFAVGVITSIDDSADLPRVTVQTKGPVALTEAQWDDVTGDSGGLTPGAVYFLSDVTNGGLTTSAPSDPGTFVCQVGTALNATTLILSTPAFPRENT